MKPKFKVGAKDGPSRNWVLEVTPDLRSNLPDCGRIYLGFQRCRVRDFVSVRQCHTCHQYGHIAKFCKGKKVCATCGKDHPAEASGDKEGDVSTSTLPKVCIPCVSRGLSCSKASTRECASYKLAEKRYLDRIDYGS